MTQDELRQVNGLVAAYHRLANKPSLSRDDAEVINDIVEALEEAGVHDEQIVPVHAPDDDVA